MTRRLHHQHHRHHGHDAAPLQTGEAGAMPAPESVKSLRLLEQPLSKLTSIFKRSPSGDCSSNDTGASCDKPSSSNNVSLPVALGVVIPLALAIIIFVYLHRRHVKRLRSEDANDPHKSLDFGWDPTAQARVNRRGKSRKIEPEMAVNELGTEKGTRRERGMSMDMDLGSPYLLPPGLSGSRESLHSMSRTMHQHDDRYRSANHFNSNDATSMHSHNTRRGADDSSSYAGSVSTRRTQRDDMRQDLLGNAQRMSRSMPPNQRTPVPQIQIQMPETAKELPRKALPSSPTTPSSAGLSPGVPLLGARDSHMSADLRKSNNYLGALIHSREPSSDLLSQKSEYATPCETPSELPTTNPSTLLQTDNRKSPPPIFKTVGSRPPRQQSLRASTQASMEQNFIDDASDYGEGFKVTPPSPHGSQPDQNNKNRRSSQTYMPQIDEYTLGVDENAGLGYDIHRLSMGVRPLPPDDPSDNPEQRANRIRSFYKEYFDESKPGPMPAAGGYYEDYDQDYLGDDGTTFFDPISGQFVTARAPQYTEPYGRRAMTPPPRATPRFGRQHAATMSGSSRLMPPGPRAFSSASGRFGPSGRGLPKKKLPPPEPLRVIPSPSLMKEDAFALPIDFAPPTSAKERVAGRPESPRGGLRPFSPMVPAHVPLQASYDDLAPMPSPHLLRKSGTFTALDFAPPPRFRSNDTASDAGSIRSNRSAMSAQTQHAIRAGAYRVSRIPKEAVGTKNETMNALKPQWNMHNNDSRIGLT